MAEAQPMDFIQQFIRNMINRDAPIYQEEPTSPNVNFGFAHGPQMYGRLEPEQFGGLSPESQNAYLSYMQQAPNAAFAKLWPEEIRSPQGHGISKEIIDSLLRPYLDVQRTGLPQGF